MVLRLRIYPNSWEISLCWKKKAWGLTSTRLTLPPLVARGNACVVGKLLVDRTVGKEIIKTPLIRAWQPTRMVSFKALGVNLFLIEFEFKWDKTTIMEGCPSPFDGHLVSLADFDGLTPLT